MEKSTLESIAENINAKCNKLKLLFYTKQHCFLLRLKNIQLVQNKKEWILGDPKKVAECRFLVYAESLSVVKLVQGSKKGEKAQKRPVVSISGIIMYKFDNGGCSRVELVIEEGNLRCLSVEDFLDLVVSLKIPRSPEEVLSTPEQPAHQSGTEITKEETVVKIRKVSVEFGQTISLFVKGLSLGFGRLGRHSKTTLSFRGAEVSCSAVKMLSVDAAGAANRVTGKDAPGRIVLEQIETELQTNYGVIGPRITIRAWISAGSAAAIERVQREVVQRFVTVLGQGSAAKIEEEKTKKQLATTANIQKLVLCLTLPSTSIRSLGWLSAGRFCHCKHTCAGDEGRSTACGQI